MIRKYLSPLSVVLFALVGITICGQWLEAAPLMIKKAATPPVIDGVPSEECWKQADRRPLQHFANGKLKVGGTVALCYDDKNLYAAYWLDEPEPGKMKTPKVEVNAPSFWDGEVLEWFINPAADGEDYFQLGFNAVGSQFNAKCHATGGGNVQNDMTWKPRWQAMGKIGEKGWTAEASIAFAELGQKAPAEGAKWAVNLCRTRVIGEREFSALSPTGGAFHTPERFQEVWFTKYVEPVIAPVEQTGPVEALIGCWSAALGYDALIEARVQLDRALGEEHVQIRTCNRDEPVNGWPSSYDKLRHYSLVVITDLPATTFTENQLQDLVRYVKNGGHLVMISSLSGWLHDPQKSWINSPLKEILPVEPPYIGGYVLRKVTFADVNHPLFRGVKLAPTTFAQTGLCKTLPGATVLATVDSLPKENAAPGAFISEKKSGNGSMLVMQGYYCQHAGQYNFAKLKDDFFQLRTYPLFWDNLVQYLTGRPVPHPAMIPEESPAPQKVVSLSLDLIRDNYGDIFRPGGKIRVAPMIEGKVEYPYQLEASIEGANLPATSAGTYALVDSKSEAWIPLPYLDRGVYALRLDLTKQRTVVDSVRGRFSVALPLIAPDEFIFSVFGDPGCLGEKQTLRIASGLKSIGFTEVDTIGGITYSGYRNVYRFYDENRFYSRLQETGLRTCIVWYPLLYDLFVPTNHGNDPESPPIPDGVYPCKQFLPWEFHWMDLFGERVYGRMPLTDGYVIGDELTGIWLPQTEKMTKSYETMSGTTAPKDAKDPSYYDLLQYRLGIGANLIWLARSASNAYEPSWEFDSVLTPNSFAGHTSCLLAVKDSASSLGVTSPDEYWYGEPRFYQKTLKSMGVVWSATDFGRLAKPGFTGGQLANNYYMEFPEQVFAAISAGTREFKIFWYASASFEKNGRQDPRFAEIAKRTTVEGSRIGRTLNHYSRSRARVAMLYPHTTHVITSMGKKFNPDYLQMTGTSDEYLDLTFAMEVEYEALRRMFGHVDILFDEQVRRGDLKNYDVFVLGYCKQVEERTLREARRFVEGGGTLLVSTDSGRLNELQKTTGTLYDVLPASVGEERPALTDYSGTSMRKADQWSTGNVLAPKPGAEVLFNFPDKAIACVRGAMGRGEAIVLGMPLAALAAKSNRPKVKLLAYVLGQRAQLISKPDDGEFSAITFTNERDDGRIFMVANHNKAEAHTQVIARGDEDEAKYTLADIVTGEKIPFAVKDGVLSFDITVADRWGRALALLKEAPASIEVSASESTVTAGKKFMLAVRLLGRDGQPVHATLPFSLTVTDPEGKVRDDLSGVRVVDRGVYMFAMPWPEASKKGKWTVTVSDKISGGSDSASWEVR